MIVARPKSVEEIASMLDNCQKVLLVGCAGCVTACLAGGEKETEILALALRLMRQRQKRPLQTVTFTYTRQCDPESLRPLDGLVEETDVTCFPGLRRRSAVSRRKIF